MTETQAVWGLRLLVAVPLIVLAAVVVDGILGWLKAQ